MRLHGGPHGVLPRSEHSGSQCAHAARAGVRFIKETAYLEKLKEHVVEVGRHVDDVQGLSGAFGWEETHKQKGFSVGVGGVRSPPPPGYGSVLLTWVISMSGEVR